jgi:RNA polymerase sigma factor (sigma-70 family)
MSNHTAFCKSQGSINDVTSLRLVWQIALKSTAKEQPVYRAKIGGMAELDAKTTVLVQLLERMKCGDRDARDELIRAFQKRLEYLTRKMLLKYPGVGRWVEAEDVLQGSLLRLLRALESVTPESTRGFFGLAAEQMRRELLDLARHLYGPQGLGTNYASVGTNSEASRQGIEPADPGDDDLERWCRFHEEVNRLPAQEREVVGLIYYHGWSQAQVAELFQVNVRTVRRWWEAALVKLHRELKDEDGVDRQS